MDMTNGVPQLKPDPRDGDEKGKVFVGGLSWDTTNESLLNHFGQFGEVIDCVVMKNPTTGKSRGFGFVKFRDSNCVNKVLDAMPHKIDGREVDPHVCNPRSQNKYSQGGKSAEKNRLKIFMGGLPTNVTEEQIQEAFGQFGEIDDIIVMYDQEKQKSRGFGFLSFKNEDAVARVCQHQYVTVAGKKVECKKAEPRDGKSMAGLIPLALTAGGLVTPTGALAAGLQHMFLPSTNFQTLSPITQGLGFLPGSIIPNMPLYSQGIGLSSRYNAGLSNVINTNALNQSLMSGAASMQSPLSLSINNHYASSGLTSPLAMNLNGWPSSASIQNDNESIGYVAGNSPGSSVSGEAPSAYDSQLVPYERSNSYLSSSSSPQTNEMHLDKSGYLLYSGQAQPLGLLGSYSHEASSYGPARFLTQDGKVHTAASFQNPFGNALTYATAPTYAGQIHGLSGASIGSLPSNYNGLIQYPIFNTESSLTGLPARSITTAMSYHPYRRTDDSREIRL